MELVFVTGMSGAGKSQAIHAMEDIGFYCVDNIPLNLLENFVKLYVQSQNSLSKVAIVVDVRGGENFAGLYRQLVTLKQEGFGYKLLYLDCQDQVIIHRYKETRRKHPLLDGGYPTMGSALQAERNLLDQAKEMADYTIDTTLLKPAQLKERIASLFLQESQTSLLVSCTSFGFKYGIQTEADLVFDLRCLPNPFYVASLKELTGLDETVKAYVLNFPEAAELLKRLQDLLDFLLPLYLSERRSQLTVALGCTGGKHRSVVFATEIHGHLEKRGYRTSVSHRDIDKR